MQQLMDLNLMLKFISRHYDSYTESDAKCCPFNRQLPNFIWGYQNLGQFPRYFSAIGRIIGHEMSIMMQNPMIDTHLQPFYPSIKQTIEYSKGASFHNISN